MIIRSTGDCLKPIAEWLTRSTNQEYKKKFLELEFLSQNPEPKPYRHISYTTRYEVNFRDPKTREVTPLGVLEDKVTTLRNHFHPWGDSWGDCDCSSSYSFYFDYKLLKKFPKLPVKLSHGDLIRACS